MKKFIVAYALDLSALHEGAVVDFEKYEVVSIHYKLEAAGKSLRKHQRRAEKNKRRSPSRFRVLGYDGKSFRDFTRRAIPPRPANENETDVLGGIFSL